MKMTILVSMLNLIKKTTVFISLFVFSLKKERNSQLSRIRVKSSSLISQLCQKMRNRNEGINARITIIVVIYAVYYKRLGVAISLTVIDKSALCTICKHHERKSHCLL